MLSQALTAAKQMREVSPELWPELRQLLLSSADPQSAARVQLSYFTVEHGPEGVVVCWGTLAEERTCHFRVLRGLGDTQQEAVEIGRVTSLGSRGGDYRLPDPAAPARGARYWLIEVERDGTETAYGPVVDGAQVFVPLVER